MKSSILKRWREGEEATASAKRARCAPAPAQTPQQLESAQRDLLRAQEQQYRASLQALQAPQAPQTMPPPQAPQLQRERVQQRRQLDQLQSIIASRHLPQVPPLQAPQVPPQVPPLQAPPPFALPDSQQRQLLEALQRAERAMRALRSAQCAQSTLLEAQGADQALQKALMCAQVQAAQVAKHEMPIIHPSSAQQTEELHRRAQPLREQLQLARAQQRELHALVERMRAPPPLRQMAPPPPPAPAAPPQATTMQLSRELTSHHRCSEGHR